MWTRKELKKNARSLLFENYCKAVIVAVILTVLSSAGQVSVSYTVKNAYLDRMIAGFSFRMLLALAFILAGAALLSIIVHLILTIFIWNPIEVGCERFFLDCKDESAKMTDMLFAFKNGYGHVGMVMLWRTIFNTLWYLLLIIPGIVKSYEYMMIPYLLADDPTLTKEKAFAESKAMMNGNKWKAFVLDLSFLGWDILGSVTFGIIKIFYADPYRYLTRAELYHTLKNQNM